MERLTENTWRNLDPWECCGQNNYCQRDCHEQGGCTKGCIVPKIYSKLAEYEDFEEFERLVILPCNIGDKLYWFYLGDTEIYDGGIVEYFYSSVNLLFLKATNGTFQSGEFGKTVFLTREEAEVAIGKKDK